jgi:hypothetical protein
MKGLSAFNARSAASVMQLTSAVVKVDIDRLEFVLMLVSRIVCDVEASTMIRMRE